MTSLADTLRAETVARVLAMTVEERIALALSLGDDDLALYVRATGADVATARRQLHSRRQRGRIPSACAGTPRP